MTRNAKRMRAVLSGKVKPRISDKYAVLATIHQKVHGHPVFGCDFSDCIEVFDHAVTRNELAVRAMVEEWQGDVNADLAAEWN